MTAVELARLVRPLLDELPNVRAFLGHLSPGMAWAAIASSTGSVLRHPIAVTGGLYDDGHNPDGARGNGWAQLTGAILGSTAQRGRTAARHWADAMEAGIGVRLPRKANVGPRGWTAPARRRRDGTLRASAGRLYTKRKYVQGEAFFACWALKQFYMCPELAPLRAALARVLPDRWRDHARMLAGRGGRVGYWHRIKRTRQELAAYRAERENTTKTRRKQRRIIATYYLEKRSGQAERTGSRPALLGVGASHPARPGADPPARRTATGCFSGEGPSTSSTRRAPPMPLASPQTVLERDSTPSGDVRSPVAARSFLRALLSERTVIGILRTSQYTPGRYVVVDTDASVDHELTSGDALDVSTSDGWVCGRVEFSHSRDDYYFAKDGGSVLGGALLSQLVAENRRFRAGRDAGEK